jgi:hypothetical protein
MTGTGRSPAGSGRSSRAAASSSAPVATWGSCSTPYTVHWTKDQTDAYRCFQGIYSPRHRRHEPPDLARVSEGWPLRVVFYNEIPQCHPRFTPWLAGMLTRYRLRSLTPYPVSSLERLRGETWDQLYVILEFVPSATAAGPVAGPAGPPVLRR